MNEIVGYLHRIPDIVGTGQSAPDSGDMLVMDYQRTKYGI